MPDVLVRPRRGYILDGIPPKGAHISQAQADEWVRNGLVVRVAPAVAATTTPDPHRKPTRPRSRR
jgi:hypothetical protein